MPPIDWQTQNPELFPPAVVAVSSVSGPRSDAAGGVLAGGAGDAGGALGGSPTNVPPVWWRARTGGLGGGGAVIPRVAGVLLPVNAGRTDGGSSATDICGVVSRRSSVAGALANELSSG